MLSPLILCFLLVLLGVASARNGRDTSSSTTPAKNRMTAHLRHAKDRYHIFSGIANHLDSLAENIAPTTIYQSWSIAMAQNTNTDMSSKLEISRGQHKKLPKTQTRKGHRRSFLGRIRQNTEEVPLPKRKLEVSRASVVCCTPVAGLVGTMEYETGIRGQEEVDGQETGQAQLEMDHDLGHGAISRPSYYKPHHPSGRRSSSWHPLRKLKPTSYPQPTDVPIFVSLSVVESNTNPNGEDQSDKNAGIVHPFLVLFFFFLFPVPLCVLCCCGEEND